MSLLDKTAWTFDLDAFLAELDGLYQRGARNFKFVDRTFNLKIDASVRILQFFMDKLRFDASVGAGLFVHFEVIPDHLPNRLKAMIAQFPPGVLQFAVGIQSFNVEVQQRISRRQDNDKTEANLRWLVNASHAHLHTDLIFGLPGESLASFAQSFDRLHSLQPHEIQLGILKCLRGTPIARHTAEHGMVYEPEPPYTVLQTHAVTRSEMQRFTRLARYWDLVANSGRFARTLAVLMQGPEALVDALFDYLSRECGHDVEQVRQTLLADYLASGARARPASLRDVLPAQPAPMPRRQCTLSERQDRHAPYHPIPVRPEPVEGLARLRQARLNGTRTGLEKHA